jgi:F-type H+-transporting ATPase subunit epsilon
MIRYTDVNGKEHYIFVSGGFAEALPNKVTVLAESAETSSDIDIERAKAALQRAEERMAEARSREDVDFNRARGALKRAAVRIRIAGK